MAEIAVPLARAGTWISNAPNSTAGVIAAVKGDGTVAALVKWDPVQGDVTHTAPSGSTSGGGSRRHLFDRPIVSTAAATFTDGTFDIVDVDDATIATASITTATITTGTIATVNAITANAKAFVIVAGATGGYVPGSIFRGLFGEGFTMQGIVGSVYDFSLYTPTGGFPILTVPTGTRNIEVVGTIKTSNGFIATAGGLSVAAGPTNVQTFGCNGAVARAKATLGNAATDLPSALTLANNLRTMAINNGMGQT